jgi:DNA-binding CsgD family transcriptional regulator
MKKKPLYYLNCLSVALLLIACGRSGDSPHAVQASGNFPVTIVLLLALTLLASLLAAGFIRYKKQFMKAKKDVDRLSRQQISWFKKARLIEHKLLTFLKDPESANSLKKKIYNELYGTSDIWHGIHSMLKKQHGKRLERLQQQLPLTEQEFRLCCMSYAGFSDRDISLHLQLKPQIIKLKKSDARQKLGISGRDSIKEFMKKKLKDESEDEPEEEVSMGNVIFMNPIIR